jgi:acyl-CoA synthetase (AMP-forming)/AMP-acid ligase II
MFFDSQPGRLTESLTGRSFSSAEIVLRAAARIQDLQDTGVRRGDRVFVRYGNKIEFFIDLLGVWYLGASAVPIDSRLTPFEIANLACTVRPRLMLVDLDGENAANSEMEALGTRVIAVNDRQISAKAVSIFSRFPCRAYLDDEALILFTSGSTAKPKGVVHTHRSLRARWISLRDNLGVDAFRRTLCLLPTHFGHGLICNSLFPWLTGQDLVIAPPFNVDSLMRLGSLVDEYKITFLSSVPSIWGLVLKASKPPRGKSLRRVHCGSAPLSAHLWNQIQKWSGTNEVFNAYGITETGSWVAGSSMGEFTPEDGLIGIPWGAVVKILNRTEGDAPFDPAANCKAEENGYIWINTPALMRGYYAQPELTDQVVSGGWFLTGDIGLIDSRGWLYLKGRERDEINKGGAKIYPVDVDAVVERFEHTKEVCSFGVEDVLYGQNVAMAVVLEHSDAATIRALHGWMSRHLAEFKMPVRWYIVESLPRSSRGKINRKDVAEICVRQPPLDLPKLLRA